MRLNKIIRHALNMVLHAKLRSWLTILGIVIGVGAVISIVSLGETMQKQISSQLGDLGGDLLTLRAGASRASFFGPGREGGGGGASAVSTEDEIVLDKTDLQVLKSVSGIKSIDTQISGQADIYYVAEKGSASVVGVEEATWATVTTSKIAEGRMLGPADTNVIVVGGRIADGFFSRQVGLNQLITIEDRLFRIVGILDDTSSSIYMPIDSAYAILEDKDKDEFDTIIIQVKDEDAINSTMASIEYKLAQKRHVLGKKYDFTLTSNKAVQAQRSEMMGSMTTFLTAIAAVALLVGAVGIANTMFTSVLEKTKEIGIMKAIGARNSDILKIFLIHAALIGLIGGILGLALGYILSGILPSLMSSSGGGPFSRFGSGDAIISLNSVVLAIGISVIIGIVAGTIPAVQASKLKPVDALRYE
ncbi:MAG: ABC transporter permease [Candidatus Woesearchaeota archaeon]|nr:ABC transporter permease [Candidatus Woesearchaeota archaeon]